MYKIPVQQGWQCPVCNRVNAPWKPVCDCHVLNTPVCSDKTITIPYLEDYLKSATNTPPEAHYGYSVSTTQASSEKNEGDLNGVHTSIRN